MPESQRLVVCVDNEGYPASLEKRKIYVALPDPSAEKKWASARYRQSGED
jgi:hypothetical protein